MALITAYAKIILQSNAVTAAVGGILVVLYGYLYILLQLADYALNTGSTASRSCCVAVPPELTFCLPLAISIGETSGQPPIARLPDAALSRFGPTAF